MEHTAEAHTHTKKGMDRRVLALAAFLVIVVGGGAAALSYYAVSNRTVYIENAKIEAPVADLAPARGGVLREFYVSPGQTIAPNTVVAQVGVELIKSTSGGLVLDTNGEVGKLIPAGQTVVEVIDPSALRAVGQVQEDKGLAEIKVGQPASFTVDAFGREQFTGVVDEVAPSSNQGDVVFSVSDKREEQNFDVKVKFNTSAHPELKQGMSAKIWIYKQ
ncbi:MAG: HlyD family secretion protein [Candidatus Kaiserbacteria bacterium]|nr:HlyD family secretion protein [Candidatus Kaiserbacteria bacterium]